MLIFILTIGTVVTMYSLAGIATLAMFASPERTVPTIIPVFLIWFILIFLITAKTQNLDKKARQYEKFIHQLDQAKSEFVAMASHQLRTPLTGMKWILERIKSDENFPTAYAPDVLKMYLSNEGMIQLVANILNNARIETGQLLVNKERCDLRDLINEVIESLSTNAQIKEQKLVSDIHKEENTETFVDKMLFTESLKNFISNAINYGNPNSIITVKVVSEPDMFTISVHNFGNPIPLEQRKKLFQKFERHVPEENQIVPRTEVGGIGLFIVKAFVAANGGTVWFDSLEEKGTTFFFTLPRVNSIS